MRESVLFEVYFVTGSAAVGLLLTLAGMEIGLSWLLALLPYLGRNVFYVNRLARYIFRHPRLALALRRGVRSTRIRNANAASTCRGVGCLCG